MHISVIDTMHLYTISHIQYMIYYHQIVFHIRYIINANCNLDPVILIAVTLW